MITFEAAQEACEALGHVALKNLRNQPHLGYSENNLHKLLTKHDEGCCV